MNQSLIVKPYLDKAGRDIADATEALGTYWSRGAADLDYRVADIHLATEALVRALASVSLAVERLAELVVEP